MGDISGDGMPDLWLDGILEAAAGSTTTQHTSLSTASTWLVSARRSNLPMFNLGLSRRSSGGQFALSAATSTVARSQTLAVGDVDGDGYADIFEGTGAPAGSLGSVNSLWLNDGTGIFAKRDAGVLTADADVSTAVVISVGKHRTSNCKKKTNEKGTIG